MQIPGLNALFIDYDIRGRLKTVTSGTGIDERQTVYNYGLDDGFLGDITDSLSQQTGFGNDLVGRITSQILPDLREIGFSYDANGNLETLTPPGRPAHAFTYTDIDLEVDYIPPTVTNGGNTTHGYDVDRQLDLTTRPDNKTLDPDYDAGRSPGYADDFRVEYMTLTMTPQLGSSTASPIQIVAF